ncbi:MAG: cyclopropane-fatty-acyl-phospholipid synthase family protein [Pseudomonadota bacterium]
MWNLAADLSIDAAERGWVPDTVIRRGIRHLVRSRLRDIRARDCEQGADSSRAFVRAMNAADIALVPDLANEQHYEVPAEFFALTLGKHRKYSCCYWPDSVVSLDEAEARSLQITCERADIGEGQRILELGCGWGSLTLWMAARYPSSMITAVSNSHSQREHIESTAAQRGLRNINVITADMNQFSIDSPFDRIVSVEMFEHMRNYQRLYGRIRGWLKPDGKFFKHIFCHRSVPYEFVDDDASDWMSRYFFSGGIMPSDALPLHFQDDLRLTQQWRWNGTHYERTANAWIDNMMRNRDDVMAILKSTYGEEDAVRWWNRWKLFFAACAELFGYDDGQEWWVSHYLFEPKSS